MTPPSFDWTGRTVLVTGAGGFIGSHLAERLVALGARVRGFVRYNALGAAGWLDRSAKRREFEIVFGDIRDRDSVTGAAKGADTIFHLAALIGIPWSYEAPRSYVATNVEGSLNVFQAALAAGARRVVHTSTSEVYGTAQYVPIDEAHPLVGQSPYSATKVAADKLAESFHRSFHLPVATIRPFNTYGPRQSARGVIPTVILQALHGQAIRIGNLTATRDFNYVADTVEGFLALAAVNAAIGRTANVGSGREVSIRTLIETVLRIVGRDLPIAQEEQRLRPPESEVERLCAANALAAELTGWTSKVAFEDGLARTIEWLRAETNPADAERYVV